MHMHGNNIKIILPTSNVTYKILRFVVKYDYLIYVKKLEKSDDTIDLAQRSDNVLLMSPVNVVSVCTTTLTNGAYSVTNYKNRNYDNCHNTCFIVDLNANIRIMALAVWYKKNITSEINEIILCSKRIIKIKIFKHGDYSKQICKDSFMRQDYSNVNMLYANCNQEDKRQYIFIDIDTKNEHVVEIAVYNKWSIEHLPLKCVNNEYIKNSTINSKKHQTIPWNLIVEATRRDYIRPLDKSLEYSYNKLSVGITDNNIVSCFQFNFNNKIVLFKFEFKLLVLIKSITFITGLSLENNASFIINQYSNIQDSPIKNKLNNINECNIKSVQNMSITYNG